jgi:aryl-alcohol dehydrogenase-like predicted oxidoreductase
MGFLAGGISARTRFGEDDFRAAVPRFAPGALSDNFALVRLVQSWARRKEVTPARLALAWLTARKPWIAPIPARRTWHTSRRTSGPRQSPSVLRS